LQNAARLAAGLNAPIKSCQSPNESNLKTFQNLLVVACYWIKKFSIFLK
jgi:hypothetical protein